MLIREKERAGEKGMENKIQARSEMKKKRKRERSVPWLPDSSGKRKRLLRRVREEKREREQKTEKGAKKARLL